MIKPYAWCLAGVVAWVLVEVLLFQFGIGQKMVGWLAPTNVAWGGTLMIYLGVSVAAYRWTGSASPRLALAGFALYTLALAIIFCPNLSLALETSLVVGVSPTSGLLVLGGLALTVMMTAFLVAMWMKDRLLLALIVFIVAAILEYVTSWYVMGHLYFANALPWFYAYFAISAAGMAVLVEAIMCQRMIDRESDAALGLRLFSSGGEFYYRVISGILSRG